MRGERWSVAEDAVEDQAGRQLDWSNEERRLDESEQERREEERGCSSWTKKQGSVRSNIRET